MVPPQFPTAEDLADHPGLIPWLEREEWRDQLPTPIHGEIPNTDFAAIKIGENPNTSTPKLYRKLYRTEIIIFLLAGRLFDR
jgi:hypothetical protein